MKISPARAAAFDTLFRIDTEKAYSSHLLPEYEKDLEQKDRSLCHELTLGVLRRKIYLDRAIDYLAEGKRIDTGVRIALRMGLYQLLFLDKIPPHAAINESVELVIRAKKRSAKGFVNAILRRATRDAISFDYVDDLDRLSTETSHPRWLLERWVAQFGDVETAKIAAANNLVPPMAFRTLGGSGLPAMAVTHESEFVTGCHIADRLTDEIRKLADDGLIYFQDEGSQMVAASIELSAGKRFLDVCAAPGGKTTMIARSRERRTALCVAGDLHWPRIKFLAENCDRQAVGDVCVVQYDAEKGLPFADQTYDVVLVDAPCSGTGTIRHNPELRYFLAESDLLELPQKQLNVLENASKVVTLGGTLVYSTCSLERDENEAVCERFMRDNEGFEKVGPGVPERFWTNDGFARTFTHRDGMDGFFVARFVRRQS